MEQNRSEEKTVIEKALSRGQEISFPVGEAPAKIELSLGGVRNKHSEGAGAKPATLSIYKVSELPKLNGQHIYDGYIIDPTCAYVVASDEHHYFMIGFLICIAIRLCLASIYISLLTRMEL